VAWRTLLTQMPDLKFGCTLCGRCCQNRSIPLTLNEAIAWLEDDGLVAIFCEAHPYYLESDQQDLRALHRKKRSFAVRCGSSRMRVTAIFVAVVAGACKNLTEDLKCRIYERRPLVCQIYPAEISPFIQVNIAAKSCPPEAWQSGAPLLSAEMRRLVEESRQTDRDDVPQKQMVCHELKMNVAAWTNEGYATYRPETRKLLNALLKARSAATNIQPALPDWRLCSPSAETLELFRSEGMAIVEEKHAEDDYSFLHAAS
jgi:Fe-S-cluster containining protein